MLIAKCWRSATKKESLLSLWGQIVESLKFYTQISKMNVNTCHSRLQFFQVQLKCDKFLRKDYLLIHKNISTTIASCDLNYGIKNRLLICAGDKNQMRYSVKVREQV